MCTGCHKLCDVYTGPPSSMYTGCHSSCLVCRLSLCLLCTQAVTVSVMYTGCHCSCLVCRLYQCNVCGEGGEYESLVLDCPLFQHARIVLDQWETVLQSPDSFASVGLLHPVAYHLEPKQPSSSPSASVRAPSSAPQPAAHISTVAPSAHTGSSTATATASAQIQDATQQSLPTTAAASAAPAAQSSSEIPAECTSGSVDTQLSSAANVIEVPTDFTGAAAMPQAQGVQSAQPGTANWEAAVQLQCGSKYVRAVCQPKQVHWMAADGAASAEALEAALSAISAGEHCLDTAKSSYCIIKLSRLCGISPLSCYARLRGMLVVHMLLSGPSLHLSSVSHVLMSI